MQIRWQDLAARRVAILDEVARVVPAEGFRVYHRSSYALQLMPAVNERIHKDHVSRVLVERWGALRARYGWPVDWTSADPSTGLRVVYLED